MNKSIIYSIIFTTAVCALLGVGYYAVVSQKNDTEVLQKEIAILQGKLEVNKNTVTPQTQETNSKEINTIPIRICGGTYKPHYYPLNAGEELHVTNLSELKKVDTIKSYYEQGFILHDMCVMNGEYLLFFDFGTGYMNAGGTVSDDELYTLGQQAILVKTDKQFKNQISVNIHIPTYRLEGLGSNSCILNTAVEDTILFTCEDTVDGHFTRDWYAVDLTEQTQTTVKQYTHTYDYNTEERIETEEVLNEELFSLFPTKSNSPKNATEYNCVFSGGEVIHNECVCPLEEGQTQEEMYDQSTGYCQTTHGGPGGNAYAASFGLPYGDFEFWSMIIGNHCKNSGGEWLNARCTCPSEMTYNMNIGTCQ